MKFKGDYKCRAGNTKRIGCWCITDNVKGVALAGEAVNMVEFIYGVYKIA